MNSRKVASTLISAVMGALIVAPIQPLPAGATSARSQNILNVSTGSLIIFPSGVQTFSNTGIAYSSTVSTGTAKNFFVNNSGTFTTAGFAMIITLPTNSNVSAFKRCNLNISFTGTGVCASGSATTVAITPGSPTTYMISIPPNSFYAFQIVQNKSGSIQVNTYANSSFISTSTSNS